MGRASESTARMTQYLEQFDELLSLLPGLRLQCQPLFQWHDRNSASWAFERHRILHSLHEMLMRDAKASFEACDYAAADAQLKRAVDVCKQLVVTNTWYKTPMVVGMPEVQPEYLLALLFRTFGTKCFNCHMKKSNYKIAKTAYKFVELSNKVWKLGANEEYATKILAHYHHAVATHHDSSEAEEKDFKHIISHSTAAVNLLQDPKMVEDHAQWVTANDTVYFETPEDVPCQVMALDTAMQLCFKD